uniref:Chromosome 1 open reading frame 116 n=1 Tax=Loxodonta africana TaxID=9785 RepID=G3T401_LOXAF
MPERELWPAGPGLEPVTRIGSCDSMTSSISTHSGSSDSSYDFLSAEEKECLLFLEETIGSLDTEADSGLSTAPDQSEPAPTPQASWALPLTQPAPQAHPEETIIWQASEPRRETQFSSSHTSEPQVLDFRSGSQSLPRNIHIGRNQKPRKSTTQANNHIPGESEEFVPEPQSKRDSQSSEPILAPTSPQKAALELDVLLIPPPEAFRDSQPERCGEDSLPKRPGELSSTPQLHKSFSPQKKEEASSEAMSQKVNEKGSVGDPGQTRPPPALSSQNARAEDAPFPSGGDPHAHLAPLTAPKPRKLPPNIVLKSSRSSFHNHPQNWRSRHSEVAPGDSGLVSSLLQEQKKARKEALEKLGLPQDQDEPSFQLSKPTSSLRLKDGPSLGKVSIPAQDPSPGKAPAAKSMPTPIPKATRAKPDSGLTLQESNIPGLRQMNFKSKTLERSGIGLSSYLSAEKDSSPQTSSSLEKGSFMDKISPSVLRNSRPRPASLGTGKDFAGIQVGKLADLEQEQNSKHLFYSGQSRDKLPRPLCVSVKISPKGIPDEHRREALKKLGLLKE